MGWRGKQAELEPYRPSPCAEVVKKDERVM